MRTKPAFVRPRSVSGSVNKARPNSQSSVGSRGSRGSMGEKTSALFSFSEDMAKTQTRLSNISLDKIDPPAPRTPTTPSSSTSPVPSTPPAPTVVPTVSTSSEEDGTRSVQVKRQAPTKSESLPPPPIQITEHTVTDHVSESVFTPTISFPVKLRSADVQRKTPSRKTSSASSMFFPVKTQNEDVLERIAKLELNPKGIDQFEAAVLDFYENVQKLDPSITNPTPAA